MIKCSGAVNKLADTSMWHHLSEPAVTSQYANTPKEHTKNQWLEQKSTNMKGTDQDARCNNKAQSSARVEKNKSKNNLGGETIIQSH